MLAAVLPLHLELQAFDPARALRTRFARADFAPLCSSPFAFAFAFPFPFHFPSLLLFPFHASRFLRSRVWPRRLLRVPASRTRGAIMSLLSSLRPGPRGKGAAHTAGSAPAGGGCALTPGSGKLGDVRREGAVSEMRGVQNQASTSLDTLEL